MLIFYIKMRKIIYKQKTPFDSYGKWILKLGEICRNSGNK